MELNNEQLAFINILKDYLLGTQSETWECVDWKTVKIYAERHQVAPIIYHQTKNKIFQSAFAAQIYRNTNFNKVIDEVKTALAGVQFIFVKGVTIANLYQIPSLRTMGDADIIIRIDDKGRIQDKLLEAGFQFVSEEEGEANYTKNSFHIEVHDSLVHRRDELEKLVNYFSCVWDYVDEAGILDWSFHLIYLLEHLRHHFVGSGVGFRQFMDIAIVCKECEINWNYVRNELEKINLFAFASVVFAFIKKWFDITVPFETSCISEEFFVEGTQKIFNDGVFGFDNEKNKYADVAEQMHYGSINKNVAQNKYLMKTVFPDYETMCRLSYCSYVKKGKILLPVAWVQRVFYRMFNKTSRDTIKQQLSNERIRERMVMLEKWGL